MTSRGTQASSQGTIMWGRSSIAYQFKLDCYPLASQPPLWPLAWRRASTWPVLSCSGGPHPWALPEPSQPSPFPHPCLQPSVSCRKAEAGREACVSPAQAMGPGHVSPQAVPPCPIMKNPTMYTQTWLWAQENSCAWAKSQGPQSWLPHTQSGTPTLPYLGAAPHCRGQIQAPCHLGLSMNPTLSLPPLPSRSQCRWLTFGMLGWWWGTTLGLGQYRGNPVAQRLLAVTEPWAPGTLKDFSGP